MQFRSGAAAFVLAAVGLAACDDSRVRDLETKLSDSRVNADVLAKKLTITSEELDRATADCIALRQRANNAETELQSTRFSLQECQSRLDTLSLELATTQTALQSARARIEEFDSAPGWTKKAAWAKMAVGMTKSEVIELLGPPPAFVNGEQTMPTNDPRHKRAFIWYYPKYGQGSVEFSTNGDAWDRVSKWETFLDAR